MRSLITGGAGFVGRHLTSLLIKNGFDLTIVDNYQPGGGSIPFDKKWLNISSAEKNKINFINQDCRAFFADNPGENFDVVFHLAAIIGGRNTIEKNPISVASDLSIDSSMWEWAKNLDIHKIYCFSSSAAYPVSLQSLKDSYKLKEVDIDFQKSIGVPDLTYGWAKLTHEYIAKVFAERFDTQVITLRPFSGYGIDQDTNYPFPSILRRAHSNFRNNVNKNFVWGNGLQTRDFIHIEDIVNTIFKTLSLKEKHLVLNLSTGIGTNFIELMKLCCLELGYESEIMVDTSQPTGVEYRVGDTTRQQEFGFHHEINLKSAIRQAYENYELEIIN